MARITLATPHYSFHKGKSFQTFAHCIVFPACFFSRAKVKFLCPLVPCPLARSRDKQDDHVDGVIWTSKLHNNSKPKKLDKKPFMWVKLAYYGSLYFLEARTALNMFAPHLGGE